MDLTYEIIGSLSTVCVRLCNIGNLCLYIGPLWPTKYWKNTTACLQHKPQIGCHKTAETI